MGAWVPMGEARGARRTQGGVLVVDDDPTIRMIVRGILEDEGCRVYEAANGAEALALLADEVPDVILLDMRMPVMDGWAFARAYRAGPGPHAPIAVLTATDDPRAWAEDIAADAVLPKPFDLSDLTAVIGRFTRCVADS